ALWALFRKRFRSGKPDIAPVILASETAQQREGILNTAMTIKLQRDPGRGVPWTRQLYQSLKHGMAPTRRGRGLWHFYRVSRGAAQRALRMPVEWARSKLGYTGVYFMIRGEQAPNPDSRIVLSRQRDALGMPRANLHWQLSAIDKHTVRTMVRMLDEELTRLGIGGLRASDWLSESGDAWPVDPTVGNHPIGGYHHMGATRMSADPRTGVVDSDCRVHGYANLYIAGSSVFATAGWANPTLTILALVRRLGDHLHEALGRGR
ncbi:MAG: GMC family oxidoreductase, partial [Gammaproteobacteria bacterium]|nr:GMC family oxidoreductase [Gammaproteobacteria bacterium]